MLDLEERFVVRTFKTIFFLIIEHDYYALNPMVLTVLFFKRVIPPIDSKMDVNRLQSRKRKLFY